MNDTVHMNFLAWFNQAVERAVIQRTDEVPPPPPADIILQFKPNTLPNNALFWSSGGASGDWVKISKGFAQGVGRYTLDMLWKDRQFVARWTANSQTAAEKREFWDNASEAMASISSKIVYVLTTPAGPSKNSTWDRIEFPELTEQGTPVTKICRVNYIVANQTFSNPYKIWPLPETKLC